MVVLCLTQRMPVKVMLPARGPLQCRRGAMPATSNENVVGSPGVRPPMVVHRRMGMQRGVGGASISEIHTAAERPSAIVLSSMRILIVDCCGVTRTQSLTTNPVWSCIEWTVPGAAPEYNTFTKRNLRSEACAAEGVATIKLTASAAAIVSCAGLLRTSPPAHNPCPQWARGSVTRMCSRSVPSGPGGAAGEAIGLNPFDDRAPRGGHRFRGYARGAAVCALGWRSPATAMNGIDSRVICASGVSDS